MQKFRDFLKFAGRNTSRVSCFCQNFNQNLSYFSKPTKLIFDTARKQIKLKSFGAETIFLSSRKPSYTTWSRRIVRKRWIWKNHPKTFKERENAQKCTKMHKTKRERESLCSVCLDSLGQKKHNLNTTCTQIWPNQMDSEEVEDKSNKENGQS